MRKLKFAAIAAFCFLNAAGAASAAAATFVATPNRNILVGTPDDDRFALRAYSLLNPTKIVGFTSGVQLNSGWNAFQRTTSNFNATGDKILLDPIAFSKLKPVRAFATAGTLGRVSANDFWTVGIGTRSKSAFLIHDIQTGIIYYNVNPNNNKLGQPFASVAPGMSLHAADFWINSAVPEPSIWATMIIGLFVAGGVLRYGGSKKPSHDKQKPL